MSDMNEVKKKLLEDAAKIIAMRDTAQPTPTRRSLPAPLPPQLLITKQLTESKAIELVKEWVGLDEAEELDPSERKTQWAMIYDLREAADAGADDTGPILSDSDIDRIVRTHAPNQPLGQSPTSQTVAVNAAVTRNLPVTQNLPTDLWQREFGGVDDLKGDGKTKFYINNFIPEGVVLICGLPKEGKSFLAMAIVKALTSGHPLFGRSEFGVPEPVPVLFLAAESGDSALKKRVMAMGITRDKKLFLCRTLERGTMLQLDSMTLQDAVRKLKPVVVLETLIRFNDGSDEDSATENRKLADALFNLRACGARCVIGIHHSTKALDKKHPTKEQAVRGSGDALAMPDAVLLVMQDEKMLQRDGVNQVDVMGWFRDHSLSPIRLALTRKKLPGDPAPAFSPGVVSYIDTKGDFEWVNRLSNPVVAGVAADNVSQLVEKLVIETPSATVNDLVAKTNLTDWEIRKTLKQLGYRRGRGRHGVWSKA